MNQWDVLVATVYSLLSLAALVVVLSRPYDGLSKTANVVACVGPVFALVHVFLRRRFRCPRCKARLKKSARKRGQEGNRYFCAACDVIWEIERSFVQRSV